MSQDSTVVEHPFFAGLRGVQAGLADLSGVEVWTMSDGDVEGGLAEIAVAEAQLAAGRLALVAEADTRNRGVADATSTAGWLRARLLLGPGEATGAVRLARELRSDCPATGAALGRGVLSVEHARVICRAVTGLPGSVDGPSRVAAEGFLLGQASVLDPVLLRRAADALAEVLTTRPDRDGRILADITRREFTAVPAYDGMVLLRGQLDREAWAQIAAVLHPLSAPTPATDGTLDPRCAARRRADGLLQMARSAAAAGPDAGGPTGPRPTLTVTIDLQSLSGQLGRMGRLGTGEPISAAAARRIGCDAELIPILLGSAGQPLDIGRATRTVPTGMHRALVCRDEACAFPACDRPAAWSDAHHITHWADGGETALTNLVLLCGEHHSTIHHQCWTVHLEADGLPTFQPPPWTDPHQTPRRHHRYQLRQLTYQLTGKDPPQE